MRRSVGTGLPHAAVSLGSGCHEVESPDSALELVEPV